MSDRSRPIRIVCAAGSVRPANQTANALALVVDEMRKDQRVAVDVIDLAEIEMPLPGTAKDSPVTKSLQEQVSSATAVVLGTPEYHGSYSSVIKLFIEQLGYPSVLSGKPVVLLGVAAGVIGAIKATEHLRSVCSHVGAIVLPGSVSVAQVHKVFDQEGNCLDPGIEKRIRRLGTGLIDYIDNHLCPRVALEQMVREGKV